MLQEPARESHRKRCSEFFCRELRRRRFGRSRVRRSASLARDSIVWKAKSSGNDSRKRACACAPPPSSASWVNCCATHHKAHRRGSDRPGFPGSVLVGKALHRWYRAARFSPRGSAEALCRPGRIFFPLYRFWLASRVAGWKPDTLRILLPELAQKLARFIPIRTAEMDRGEIIQAVIDQAEPCLERVLSKSSRASADLPLA